MKCNYCETDLNPGQRFCHRCGTRQDPALRTEPAAAGLVPPAQPVYEPPCNDNPVPRPAYEPPKFEYHLPQSYYQPLDLNKPFAIPEPEPVNLEYPDHQSAYQTPEQDSQPPAAPPPVHQPVYVPYGAPRTEPEQEAPRIQLPTGRSWAKMFFLGIVTLGIYPFVIWNKIVTELNIVASRYDGKRTVNYLGAGILSVITLGVYAFVWIHGFCRRIGMELRRRSVDYSFGATDFWLWNVLAAVLVALVVLIYLLEVPGAQWISLVLGVVYLICPLVFMHKLMKSMNLINTHFNSNG